MDKFIEDLIEKGMGQIMDQSRDALMASDEIYKEDSRREEESELRFSRLCLTEDQRMVINEYLTAIRIGNHRYADLSYMAGIRDVVRLFVSLMLLKGVDDET